MEQFIMHDTDDDYPALLHELGDAKPPVIYGKGDRSVLAGMCLSVIGARRATPYGLSVAAMAGRLAAELGLMLVSGGALGCDVAAALAALNAGGKTIVVSGAGADIIYPKTSSELFERAWAGEGVVISLIPFGTSPKRYTFVRRNTIIAALSRSTIITEAGLSSGTMSTALTARDLGRNLYAIPGSIFSPQSSGTNRLIADGATMICDEQDLEMSVSLDYGRGRLVHLNARPETSRLLSALIAMPSRPELLAERLNENILTVIRSLTELESSGVVERLLDGRYSPTQSYLLGRFDMV